MSHRQRIIRWASIGAYFIAAFAVLYWFGGRSYFCSGSPLQSTFRLTFACTTWNLIACTTGSFVARKVDLRTAAPIVAAAISGVGFASIPFWLFRGYGHFLFEGTVMDVSCFFAEEYGIAFPFVVAPALGLLTLAQTLLWLRIQEQKSVVAVE